jgi:hypothetical protein
VLTVLGLKLKPPNPPLLPPASELVEPKAEDAAGAALEFAVEPKENAEVEGAEVELGVG